MIINYPSHGRASNCALPCIGLQPSTAVTMICWGSNQMPLWRRLSTPSSANPRRYVTKRSGEAALWLTRSENICGRKCQPERQIEPNTG